MRRRARGIEHRKAMVTRRAIGEALVGFGIAGAISYGALRVAQMFKKVGATSEEAEEFATHIEKNDTDGVIVARFEKIADAPLFREEVFAFIKHYRDGGDLALALSVEHGRAPTVNDPRKRSRIDYVREEVMDGLTDDDMPADLRRELSFYATGMFATETKYQRDVKVGRAHAVGLGQAIPSTYELYGKDKEEMRYLIHQVEVMRNMFKDYYNILSTDGKDALTAIRTNYFTNDTDFRVQFLSLCLVNSYQAGVGNMLNIIKKFSVLPVQKNVRGYDVFEAMVSIAKDGSLDKNYGKESYNYAKQSTAFAFLLAGSNTKAR